MEIKDFKITTGSPKGFTKSGDSGNELTRHFCPDCGSPLFTSSPCHPDLVYVKAGAFDDPMIVQPAHQSWTRSSVPWAVIRAGLRSYETGRSRCTNGPHFLINAREKGLAMTVELIARERRAFTNLNSSFERRYPCGPVNQTHVGRHHSGPASRFNSLITIFEHHTLLGGHIEPPGTF